MGLMCAQSSSLTRKTIECGTDEGKSYNLDTTSWPAPGTLPADDDVNSCKLRPIETPEQTQVVSNTSMSKPVCSLQPWPGNKNDRGGCSLPSNHPADQPQFAQPCTLSAVCQAQTGYHDSVHSRAISSAVGSLRPFAAASARLCASGSNRIALTASLCRFKQKAMRAWNALCAHQRQPGSGTRQNAKQASYTV
jgi:hypothetical protein